METQGSGGWQATRSAAARVLAGTAAFAAAGVLLVAQSSSAPTELMGMPPSAARVHLQMLYAANPPDKNPFDSFDRGFVQGKYKKAKTVRSPSKMNK